MFPPAPVLLLLYLVAFEEAPRGICQAFVLDFLPRRWIFVFFAACVTEPRVAAAFLTECPLSCSRRVLAPFYAAIVGSSSLFFCSEQQIPPWFSWIRNLSFFWGGRFRGQGFICWRSLTFRVFGILVLALIALPIPEGFLSRTLRARERTCSPWRRVAQGSLDLDLVSIFFLFLSPPVGVAFVFPKLLSSWSRIPLCASWPLPSIEGYLLLCVARLFFFFFFCFFFFYMSVRPPRSQFSPLDLIASRPTFPIRPS